MNQFISGMSRAMAIQSIRTGLNLLAHLNKRKAGALAFDLFCRPRKKILTAQEHVFLKTGEQTDLFFEGLKIKTYRWSGTGPCVLLAHGWESHTARWQTYQWVIMAGRLPSLCPVRPLCVLRVSKFLPMPNSPFLAPANCSILNLKWPL